jgi:drug/metabolite transporter (DMT)-like permease
MASVEPVVATLAGAAVFGEKLTPEGVAGIMLVVFAVILMNVKNKTPDKKNIIKKAGNRI